MAEANAPMSFVSLSSDMLAGVLEGNGSRVAAHSIPNRGRIIQN
jgi:hypothetical protein